MFCRRKIKISQFPFYEHMQKGFSLIETIVSMVIVSIALWAVVIAMTTILNHNTHSLLLQQSITIAESYLEEVLNKNFPTLPCQPGSLNRAVYTNICDYQGLIDVGIKNQDGNPVSGLENYTVKVIVDTNTPVLNNLIVNTQVVRVDVTVIDPHERTVTISGYKTNY